TFDNFNLIKSKLLFLGFNAILLSISFILILVINTEKIINNIKDSDEFTIYILEKLKIPLSDK
ncbi:hypothetical protein, partial [Providencia stuartii]|uniref:hypothetical protein n=1 Tax=Providencia stuartii TaxID=588 RepID=UPI001C5A358B